jgi:hypothetical protein
LLRFDPRTKNDSDGRRAPLLISYQWDLKMKMNYRKIFSIGLLALLPR